MSTEIAPGSTAPPTETPPRRRLRLPDWTPAEWAVAVTVGAFVVFLAARLGPALIGQRVLAAGDLLSTLRPWNDWGTRSPVVNGNLSDSINAVLPSYHQIYERLWSGDLALRANLAGPGHVLLASPNTPVISLSEFWFLLVPTSYAVGLAKLFEMIIAFAGMTLWLRRMGTPWYAGTVAGLLYCGSAFITAWASWTAQSSVAALIPALFWVVERFLAIRTLKSAVPIAVVVGFMMTGGFPAVAGYSFYAAGVYLVVRLLADRSRHDLANSVRTFLAAGGAVGLGLALAAIQLVPFAFALADTDLSYRSKQFYAQSSFRAFLSMIYPEGIPRNGYVESYSYLGAGTLVLVAIAVFTPRLKGLARGATTYLAALLVLSVVLVWKQGWYTDWIGDLPVFSGNNSGRLRSLVAVAACALAGLGIHRIFSARPSRRTYLVMGGIATFAVLFTGITHWHYGTSDYKWSSWGNFVSDVVWSSVTVVVLAATIWLARNSLLRRIGFALLVVLFTVQTAISVSNFWPLSKPEQFYPDLAITEEIQQNLGHERLNAPHGFMGSSAAVYDIRTLQAHAFQPKAWAQIIRRIYPEAYSGPGRSSTVPLIGVDLVPTPEQATLLDRFGISMQYAREDLKIPGTRVAPDGTPVGDTELRGSVPAVTKAAGEPVQVEIAAQSLRGVVFKVAEKAADPDGVMITVTVTDPATGEQLAIGHYQRRAVEVGAVEVAVPGEDLADRTSPLLVTISADRPLRYAMATPDTVAVNLVDAVDDGVHLFYSDERGSLWTRDSALPRIRWASAAEVITDPAQRLDRLADPALPDNTVLLAADGPLPSGTGPAAVSVAQDSGDEIQVDVTAADSGYLVVADSLAAGWTVRVDGAAAPLVVADHAFGGVFVPAGTHRVTFEYTGNKLGLGLAITVLAILVVLLLLTYPALRRRFAARKAGRAEVDGGPAPDAEPGVSATATGPSPDAEPDSSPRRSE